MVKETQTTTALELAKLFGVTDRHIRDLATEGYVHKTERGKYLLVASIKGYIEYIESKNNAPADLKEEKIKEEIARIKKDTELKSIKILELKNQLHSAGIIEEVMTNMLLAMKGKLLSIPNKLAPAVIACDNLAEIQDIIHNEILNTLEELSDYDSELFKNKNYVDETEDEELIQVRKSKKEKSNEKKRGRPKKSS